MYFILQRKVFGYHVMAAHELSLSHSNAQSYASLTSPISIFWTIITFNSMKSYSINNFYLRKVTLLQQPPPPPPNWQKTSPFHYLIRTYLTVLDFEKKIPGPPTHTDGQTLGSAILMKTPCPCVGRGLYCKLLARKFLVFPSFDTCATYDRVERKTLKQNYCIQYGHLLLFGKFSCERNLQSSRKILISKKKWHMFV